MLLNNIPPLPDQDHTFRYLAAALPVCYSDATGMAHFLDAGTPAITIYEPVRCLTAFSFYCRSASDVVGNIVLEIRLDDTVQQRLVLPVGTTETIHRVNFPQPATGRLSIHRCIANSEDTLRDGETVTAVFSTDLLLEETI